ncbi:MAG: DNA alkylation repair protein [Candidatus Diapherotrites archaeon]
MLNKLIKELEGLKNPEQAKLLQRFFKTGKGEYGEGDIFLGIKVPVQRKIAEKYKELNLIKINELLKSKIHEHRLVGLIILVNKYKSSSEKEKENLFHFYLNNTKFINNWDLVDLSAPNIVGDFLLNKDRKILYSLANSENLWNRRIAIISTFNFIRKKEFEDALTISEILLKDKQDLIHKAVGWMLREIGKKDETILENFLRFHYKHMPRIMLRYAIEKFPEEKRKRYLNGKI